MKRPVLSFRSPTRRLMAVASIVVLAACNSAQRAFDQAAQQDTEQAYREFIKSHESHPLVEEARRKLELVAWKGAAASSDAAVVETFVAEFPNSSRLREAKQRIEALVLERARKQATPKALQAFLAAYPASAQRAAVVTELEGLWRQNAYKCVSGMRAGMFMILPPGSSNITFMVTSRSDKDKEGPFGHVCELKIRETVTVVLVEKDGLLRVDKEGVAAINENGGARFVSRRVGAEASSPILFVPASED